MTSLPRQIHVGIRRTDNPRGGTGWPPGSRWSPRSGKGLTAEQVGRRLDEVTKMWGEVLASAD